MIRRGTKVKITREVTSEDYKKIYPELNQGLFVGFTYSLDKVYKVIRTTSVSVILDNAAEIPKHLVKRVK